MAFFQQSEHKFTSTIAGISHWFKLIDWRKSLYSSILSSSLFTTTLFILTWRKTTRVFSSLKTIVQVFLHLYEMPIRMVYYLHPFKMRNR